MIEVGQRFTQLFDITPRIHEGFIDTFGDRHPLHTDEAFAIAHGYEGRVMHGNILNGFISFFIGECIPGGDMMILAQEIKYSKPVYMGDQITLAVEVTDVHQSVGMYEFKFRFLNQSGASVATAKLQGRLLSVRSS